MKRAFDLFGSVVALVILLPVIIAVAAAVAVSMGRPVLFRQTRPGLLGRPFELVKFRTMKDARDEHGQPLPDGARLTRFGRMLRATSLDELPELWNVAKGEMSLVGPRPLLMDYLPLYSAHQARRHEVRPGLTGLAQVRGRNALSWEEKFELDVWYVDHRSFLLDLRILAETLWHVVRPHGISAEGEATMPAFTGGSERAGAALEERSSNRGNRNHA